MELICRYDIVPHEDMQCAMSRNLHGGSCIHTRADEVANGGPSEIMGNKALVLIPRIPCLFSESTLNTCLYPLTPKIPRFEYCAVASEFLLEHCRELIREGDNQRLAILDNTGRQAYFLLG
jgi:hypothetical protein